MVAALGTGGEAWLLTALFVAEQAVRQPVLQRLEPERRAKVLAALAALIILGFGLMLLAWLGARATRRYMRREPQLHEKPPSGTPLREKDWSEKPLHPREDE